VSNQSINAKVARELMDGAMSGFNSEGVEITSCGPLEKTEGGDWGFTISGDAEGHPWGFHGTVVVTLE